MIAHKSHVPPGAMATADVMRAAACATTDGPATPVSSARHAMPPIRTSRSSQGTNCSRGGTMGDQTALAAIASLAPLRLFLLSSAEVGLKSEC